MSNNSEGVGVPTPNEEFEDIELNITLTVPKGLSEAHQERLSDALFSYAHTMSFVVEAGVRHNKTLKQDDLLHLWNEVQLAAPVVHGMAPADSVWGGMTCTEAETLAGIFAAAGRQDVHDFIIEQHAEGDDDPEDLHYKNGGADA
jgi:hypothetical protein